MPSYWAQHYLLALIPATVATALVMRRDLPVALDGMAAVLSADAQPMALCLPHPGCATAASCPALRLAPLLRTHLEPLARELAAAGLPPRVLWGNAAAVLSWTLGVVAAPTGEADVVWQALGATCWADGGDNPFRPVLSRSGCGLARRVCCLRYRLPGIAECPDCPRNNRAAPGVAQAGVRGLPPTATPGRASLLSDLSPYASPRV